MRDPIKRQPKKRPRPEPSPGSARPTTRAARPKVDIETKFEALVAKTIADLMVSKTPASDARIWKRAIAEYGKLKKSQGAPPTQNLVRFFATDGVAVKKKHRVVVKATRPIAARKTEWMALLRAAR